jgi:peptidoglycan hydrolase-like protein with peptidoglycan-binding domain
MLLERGDRGEGVKGLQRGLNKLGLLLLVDGDFGPGTEAAVADARAALNRPGPPRADDGLLEALSKLPEPSLELTAPGVSFIAREEVSSPAEYRRRYQLPTWPTEGSGITIGIGYDLRFATEAKLRADWAAVLPAPTIARLVPVLGTPGSSALLAQVKDVDVPLPAAVTVFLARMLPEHVGNTRAAYPTLDALPPARRTALISLVFNRGGDLEGGDRRREMKRIRELLTADDVDAVAEQLEGMVRLWDPAKERGVIERRRREATLWREGFAALQLV